jgi:hypothetical protein
MLLEGSVMGYKCSKTLILIFVAFFALILCGAVSATSALNLNANSTLSKQPIEKTLVSTIVYPKKIDSGVTSCYWFKGSKYYWTTYLYSDKIVVYSHFYNPNLKHEVYQKTILTPYFYGGKRSGMYFLTTPKSNGKSNYINVDGGFTGTLLQYYWTGIKSMDYWNYRSYMIKYAPNH